MSSLVIRQLPLLELLTKVGEDSRKKILKYGDQKLIEAIVECVYNVLNKNVQMTQNRIEQLKKHKSALRRIAKSGNKNIKHKKKLIVQSGGSFLPILLTPIVSYLFDRLVRN